MSYHVSIPQTAKLGRNVKLLMLVQLIGMVAGSQSQHTKRRAGKLLVRASLGDDERVKASLSSSQENGQHRQEDGQHQHEVSVARIAHNGLVRQSALDRSSTFLDSKQMPPKSRGKAMLEAVFQRAFESDSSPQAMLQVDQGLLETPDSPAQVGEHDDDPDDPMKPLDGCNDNDMGKYICQMLLGNNVQVMKRIEKVIQSFNIMEPGAVKVETAMKDQDEHIHGLKDNLWQLLFCAKRADVDADLSSSGVANAPSGACDPRTSTEPEIKAARESAQAHIKALSEEDDAEKAVAAKASLDALNAIS